MPRFTPRFNPATKPWYPDAEATSADGQLPQESTAKINATKNFHHPNKRKYKHKRKNNTETSSVHGGGVETAREEADDGWIKVAPKAAHGKHQAKPKGRRKSGDREKKEAAPAMATETEEEDDGWGWAKTDFVEEHSPSYYEPDNRTEEEKHLRGHWTDCYDDSCMLHWGAKNESGKWPQRRWSDLKRGSDGH